MRNKVTSTINKKKIVRQPGGYYIDERGKYYLLCCAGKMMEYVCVSLENGGYWRTVTPNIDYACGNLTPVPPGTKITIEVEG